MYTVYWEGEVLHDYRLEEDGRVITDPIFEESVSMIGEFAFSVDVTHPLYDKLQKIKTYIYIYIDGEEIVRCRIIEEEKDVNNSKRIFCECDLGLLKDSLQRPYQFTGDIPDLFKKYINTHNQMVESEKQFRIGVVTVTDSNNYVNRSNTTYLSTWDSINTRLIETHGGYIRTRKEGDIRYVDLIEDYGNVSDQVLQFGENIVDITQYIDTSNVFTALIPLGEVIDEETNERLTIVSENGGVDYVYSPEAVEVFGWIWRTEIWDDVTLAKNLLTKGRQHLQNNIEMQISITLNAVDLSQLHADIKRIKKGDWVRVISRPHGIDNFFMVSRKSINLESPERDEITLGFDFGTMTESQIEEQKKIQNGLNDVQSTVLGIRQTASTAKLEAATAKTEVEEVKTTVNKVYEAVENMTNDYIRQREYREFKESLGKAAYQGSANDLDTEEEGYLLDARQGKVLKEQLEAMEEMYQELAERVEKLENPEEGGADG